MFQVSTVSSSTAAFPVAGAFPRLLCTWRSIGLHATWVRVAGELDLATSPELREALLAAQRDASLVVLDLRDLTFIDSSGIHVIVDANRHPHARLVVARGSAWVDRVFTLTRACDHLLMLDLDPSEQPAQAQPNLEGGFAAA